MSWVKYSKDAQKHEAARHAKRELIKIAEMHKEYSGCTNIYMKVSGVEKQDLFHLRCYETWAYEELNRDITESLKQNREPGGYDGFYTTRHGKIIDFIKDIQKVMHYIINNYCLHEVYPAESVQKFIPIPSA